MRELLDAGLVHRDIADRGGRRLWRLCDRNPGSTATTLAWRDPRHSARRSTCCARPHDPFQPDGGMRLVEGNLGRAVFKTSAVDRSAGRSRRRAACFRDQDEVARGVQRGRTRPRRGGGGPLPGPARQRHARAAQADPGARACCRTAGYQASRWSPTGACRARAARCRRRSTSRPEALRRRPAGAGARRRHRPARRADRARWRQVGVDLARGRRRTAPPPRAGTGRELFALMRQSRRRAEAGASAMLAAMDIEQALGADVERT